MVKIEKLGSKIPIIDMLIIKWNEKCRMDTLPRGDARSYHTYLLTVANYGCIEGLSNNEIISEIQRATLLSGRSSARFKKIDDAIRKARQECIPWEKWQHIGRHLGTIERSYTNKYSYTNPQRDEGPSPDAFLRIAR